MRRLLALLALMPLSLAAFAARDDTALRLGVLAYRPKPQVMAQWQPLADYLSTALSRPVRLAVYDHAELDAAASRREIDVVFTSPGHFIHLQQTLGLSAPLATLLSGDEPRELSSFGGVIIARADREDITTLRDLAGKRIAAIAVEGLGGYQAQAFELLEAGVPLPTADKLLLTGQPQDKTITAVLDGHADAGFVRSGLIEALAHEGKLDPAQIKIINRQRLPAFPYALSTRLYPEWPVAVMPQVDVHLASRLAGALFALEHGHLESAFGSPQGFITPANYEGVEELMRHLRLPPFDYPPEISLGELWRRYAVWISTLTGLLLLLTAASVGLVFMYRRSARALHALARREHELRASEKKLADVLDNVSAYIYLKDKQGRYLYANRMVRDLFRATQADIAGQDDGRFFDDATFRQLRLNDRRVLDAGETIRLEEDNIDRATGESRSYWTVKLPLRDENGGIYALCGISTDITERKQVEEKLQRLNAELENRVRARTTELEISNAELAQAKESAEAASRAKSTFLANMSHELRTPMNGIMGMVGIALRHAEDAKQRERLQIVAQASEHLLAIINDILDISKIEAERLQLEHQAFRVGALLENLRGLIGHKIADKGLDLVIDLPEGLAEQSFMGDPVRIEQILLNLVGNALKFTERGAITIAVRVLEDGPEAALLRCEVRDTGIGIAPASQTRLFTAFEQADSSTTRKYGGTGLGLAISKRLAQKMGGGIGIESQEGQGSTFWFTARLDKAALATPRPRTPISQASAEQRLMELHTGARILLAEDEPTNQMIARDLLEFAGLQVDLAEDGAEAIALARQNLYAVILMDMQMPKVNGLDATREIRGNSRNRATPIVAMTANAFAEDRQRCLDVGMNDHIAKPVMPEIMYATLLKWLG